ncbi:MAG: GMC family oxidoreductase [Rhodospirillales bacterium]|nr:GMC family oxidoreductase [Rhodospirillales bacterium]
MDCRKSGSGSTGPSSPDQTPSPSTSSPSASAASGSTRRTILAVGLGGAAASVIAPRKSLADGADDRRHWSRRHCEASAPVEFIIVGSGAGGGPLACNLARAGHKVVLFEAGGSNDAEDVASVPFFSAFTTEDERIRWDYYVRHYTDTQQQQRSSQYIPAQDGIWYPRVGSLGGCTVHSFMVDIYPSDADWNFIAIKTGDYSWIAENMRGYFEALEQCRYIQRRGPWNPSRHGFDGWQPTEMPDPSVYADDPKIAPIMAACAEEMGDQRYSLAKLLAGQLDPNDWRLRNRREGVYDIPLFTKNGRRFGPRQLIQQTAADLPHNLIVKTHCLVTRVLFEGKAAVGVEYMEGPHLYRADPNAAASAKFLPRKTMRAGREVILAAGAFNTPQLLKLSGVGPSQELSAHGIPTIVDLPGVGRNLQDRYEVGIVTDFASDFTFAAACRPGQAVDPCYGQWLAGAGPYTGYGAVGGILRRSETHRSLNLANPDLLISVALTRFKGYFPGYSVQDIAGPGASHQLTWLILKAHTHNRAGTVKLRSADPRDTPVINFRYFEEGTDKTGKDLSSIVDGIEFARRLNGRLSSISTGDVWPGPQDQSRDELARFVRDEAWGHHASCSCKMGAKDDPLAVVDSKFRVFGTHKLRIVDASIFPRIPGYFILMPIYMISQKASDEIIKSTYPGGEFARSMESVVDWA